MGKIFKVLSNSIRDVKAQDMDNGQKAVTVTGYLSVFGVEDSDGDVIQRGAFSRTIAENGPTGKGRIKFLREHDYRKPIGKFTVLKEDDYGLFFEAVLNMTTEGKDAAILYQSGELTEHSIGFEPIGYQRREANNYDAGWNFTEVKLWEGSAVLWGANELAKVQEIKSRFETLKTMTGVSNELLSLIEKNIVTLDSLKSSKALSNVDERATEDMEMAKEILSHFRQQLGI